MEFKTFLETLESHTGKSAKRSGGGYSACCPAHDDENPSLSIKEACDGKILLHCFAGCPLNAICGSLGLEVSDLFEADCVIKQEPKRIIYSYKDEEDKELYRKIRIEPGLNGKEKSFYLEHTDQNGEIIQNIKGCRRVLYHLPEVLKAIVEDAPIFLVEGEKDADILTQYGLISTTSCESLKWPDEYTKSLEGADIVLLYDMDKTGIERRDLISKNLYGHVKQLRIVNLPGLHYQESHGPDVSDWLVKGRTISELLELINKAPYFQLQQEQEGVRSVSLGEFLEMELPKREMLLAPFLPSQGLVMLYAKRGVGKTHVVLGIGYAVAQGGHFLKWHAPQPKKVLYLDGEMSAVAMQERLRQITATEGPNPTANNNFHLITPDLQEGVMPDLSTKEGRRAIEKYVEEADLIITDNLSSLFRTGVENEADSWQPAQELALEMRRRGKSVLFVHHAGKSGQQRGTSKKEDILDAVISLKHPTNYLPSQGARFEVHYEKTRHFAGDDAIPFQVQLREDKNDGLWHWNILNVQVDQQIITIAELTKNGSTINEIMKEMGLTKSQVETRQKKAHELGLLD